MNVLFVFVVAGLIIGFIVITRRSPRGSRHGSKSRYREDSDGGYAGHSYGSGDSGSDSGDGGGDGGGD